MRSRSFAPASVSEGGMDDYYDTIKVSLFVVCYGRFVVWHEATHTHTVIVHYELCSIIIYVCYAQVESCIRM